MTHSVLTMLRRLLPSDVIPVPEDSQPRRDMIAREVVARNAEGSVRLSQGRYCTAAQIDADFESIRHASL